MDELMFDDSKAAEPIPGVPIDERPGLDFL